MEEYPPNRSAEALKEKLTRARRLYKLFKEHTKSVPRVYTLEQLGEEMKNRMKRIARRTSVLREEDILLLQPGRRRKGKISKKEEERIKERVIEELRSMFLDAAQDIVPKIYSSVPTDFYENPTREPFEIFSSLMSDLHNAILRENPNIAPFLGKPEKPSNAVSIILNAFPYLHCEGERCEVYFVPSGMRSHPEEVEKTTSKFWAKVTGIDVMEELHPEEIDDVFQSLDDERLVNILLHPKAKKFVKKVKEAGLSAVGALKSLVEHPDPFYFIARHEDLPKQVFHVIDALNDLDKITYYRVIEALAESKEHLEKLNRREFRKVLNLLKKNPELGKIIKSPSAAKMLDILAELHEEDPFFAEKVAEKLAEGRINIDAEALRELVKALGATRDEELLELLLPHGDLRNYYRALVTLAKHHGKDVLREVVEKKERWKDAVPPYLIESHAHEKILPRLLTAQLPPDEKRKLAENIGAITDDHIKIKELAHKYNVDESIVRMLFGYLGERTEDFLAHHRNELRDIDLRKLRLMALVYRNMGEKRLPEDVKWLVDQLYEVFGERADIQKLAQMITSVKPDILSRLYKAFNTITTEDKKERTSDMSWQFRSFLRNVFTLEGDINKQLEDFLENREITNRMIKLEEPEQRVQIQPRVEEKEELMPEKEQIGEEQEEKEEQKKKVPPEKDVELLLRSGVSYYPEVTIGKKKYAERVEVSREVRRKLGLTKKSVSVGEFFEALRRYVETEHGVRNVQRIRDIIGRAREIMEELIPQEWKEKIEAIYAINRETVDERGEMLRQLTETDVSDLLSRLKSIEIALSQGNLSFKGISTERTPDGSEVPYAVFEVKKKTHHSKVILDKDTHSAIRNISGLPVLVREKKVYFPLSAFVVLSAHPAFMDNPIVRALVAEHRRRLEEEIRKRAEQKENEKS